MRDFIKLIIKYIMRFCLHFFWLFPIKKNNIFFMCNMGKTYACNPKYLYEKMIHEKEFSNYKFIWAFIHPDEWGKTLTSNKNTMVIGKKNYFKFFYYLLTSKIIIYNCGGFSYAPIRKKQFLIETWHGGGAYKTSGFMTKNKSKSSKKGIEMASHDIKLFISCSQEVTEKVINNCLHYYGEVINSGLPRNDYLLNTHDNSSIRNKLGLKSNEKMVLYAPTFKGNEHNAINIDYNYETLNIKLLKDTLHDKFGGVWKVYTRCHQYANGININESDGDLSNYPDMQELLLATDILITDYSSSMWDFALTKKLCINFVPDIDHYVNNDRNFLTDINEWPGLIAKANDDIVKQISNYNENSYNKKIVDYLKKAKSYENGNASEIIIDRIIQELGDSSNANS